MPVAEHTPRATVDVLVNRHRLGDVSAGGAGVEAKTVGIHFPKVESEIMLRSQRASRVRDGFVQDSLGFSVEPLSLQRSGEIIDHCENLVGSRKQMALCIELTS